jgi:predicted DNA-binding protein
MPRLRRNLHVPLEPDLYDRLRAEASRCREPATELAREAIEAWLREREARALADAIRTYAAEAAGSDADLDPDLAAAAAEHLASEAPGPRKP